MEVVGLVGTALVVIAILFCDRIFWWFVARRLRADDATFRPIHEFDTTFRPIEIRQPSAPPRPPCWICGQPKDGHIHE